MKATLIAAMASNRVIGGEAGGIPWDLPRDREHFRAYTRGKWMLVGRVTYEEMRNWFGDRIPIVLTGDRNYRTEMPWHRTAATVPEAFDLARRNGAGELVIAGGASVYRAALPHADRILLTTLDAPFDGTARFPEFETDEEWTLVSREEWPADGRQTIAMTLELYEKSSAR